MVIDPKRRAAKAQATRKKNKLDAIFNGRDRLCYKVRHYKESGMPYILEGIYVTFSEEYIARIRRLIGTEDRRQEILALDLDNKTPEQLCSIAKKYSLQSAELQQINSNLLLQVLPMDIKSVGTCYT